MTIVNRQPRMGVNSTFVYRDGRIRDEWPAFERLQRILNLPIRPFATGGRIEPKDPPMLVCDNVGKAAPEFATGGVIPNPLQETVDALTAGINQANLTIDTLQRKIGTHTPERVDRLAATNNELRKVINRQSSTINELERRVKKARKKLEGPK